MPKLSEATNVDSIQLQEQASVGSTPASGQSKIIVLTDGTLHFVNDAGTDIDLSATASATPDFGASSSIAIASGVLAAGSNRNVVAQAETGTADDLIEITGLSVGEVIALRGDTGDTITVKHNDAGATIKILIQDDADFNLDDEHPLYLMLTSATSLVQVWDETGGSGGSIGGSTGATDNAVLRADGTGGSTLQDSPVTIDDSGNMAGVNGITLNAPTELTIASGAITVTRGLHTVDTEADAATDDLVTVNGLSEGETCIIAPNNAARDIFIRTTGNISSTFGDIWMANTTQRVLLIGTATGVDVYPLYDKDVNAQGLVTLSTGTLHIEAPADGIIRVAAESGTADDLTDITGDTPAHLYLVADSGDTITVKHSATDIILRDETDIVLDETKPLHLVFSPSALKWTQALDSDDNTMVVTNSSGAAAAINDVGYLDEAGEYQTTTTEADGVSWCVVVTGGANGASIRVQTRGNATVNYTGTAPSQGDYLVTSTTAGDAKAQSTMSPEIFAVCTAAGSGGTVAVLLYTQTRRVPLVSTNDVWQVANHSDTDFVSTINGTPTATSVVYGTVTAGNEDVINVASSSQLAKMRLHNTTRGTYRLIESVDTGTNTITTVSSPSDGWADTDAITIESQTVDTANPAIAIDLDLSQTSEIPVLARTLEVELSKLDSGASNEALVLNPFETYAGSKSQQVRTQAANVFNYRSANIPLRERTFTVWSFGSGTGTARSIIKLMAAHVAVP